jgi:hypothetical protein
MFKVSSDQNHTRVLPRITLSPLGIMCNELFIMLDLVLWRLDNGQ